jgi:hypothetical protein
MAEGPAGFQQKADDVRIESWRGRGVDEKGRLRWVSDHDVVPLGGNASI